MKDKTILLIIFLNIIILFALSVLCYDRGYEDGYYDAQQKHIENLDEIIKKFNDALKD